MFGLSRLRLYSKAARGISNIHTTSRTSQWSHRIRPPLTKSQKRGVFVIGFVFWCWVLYGIWSEPEHIVGHFNFPDPSKWTDEELGIPPDEEGLPEGM